MKRLIRSASTYVTDIDLKCKCGNHATHFMQIHQVGNCQRGEDSIANFFCRSCIKRKLAQVARICASGRARCRSCGREIVTPADVVIRVAALTNDDNDGRFNFPPEEG